VKRASEAHKKSKKMRHITHFLNFGQKQADFPAFSSQFFSFFLVVSTIEI